MYKHFKKLKCCSRPLRPRGWVGGLSRSCLCRRPRADLDAPRGGSRFPKPHRPPRWKITGEVARSRRPDVYAPRGGSHRPEFGRYPFFSAYLARMKRKSARRFKYEWTSGLSISPASLRAVATRSALRIMERARSIEALAEFTPG